MANDREFCVPVRERKRKLKGQKATTVILKWTSGFGASAVKKPTSVQ
jgi:hypothetical protein